MQVITTSMGRAGWRFLATPNTRVSDLKEALRLETGVSVDQQLLVSSGKEMPDHCCMSDIGAHTSLIVHLMIRRQLLPRGGMDVLWQTSAFQEEILKLDAVSRESLQVEFALLEMTAENRTARTALDAYNQQRQQAEDARLLSAHGGCNAMEVAEDMDKEDDDTE